MNSYYNSVIHVWDGNVWNVFYPKTTIESINANNGRPLQDILDSKLNLENINMVQFSLENNFLSIKKLPNSFKITLYNDIDDVIKQWSFDATNSTELILDNTVFAYKTDDTYGEMLSIPLATNSNNGLMTKTQVETLESIENKIRSLIKYFGEDSDTIINKVEEIIKIFEDYSEGFNLYEALEEINGKINEVNGVAENKIDKNSLKSLKVILENTYTDEPIKTWEYNAEDDLTTIKFDSDYFKIENDILQTKPQVYIQETKPSTRVPEGSVWFVVSELEGV